MFPSHDPLFLAVLRALSLRSNSCPGTFRDSVFLTYSRICSRTYHRASSTRSIRALKQLWATDPTAQHSNQRACTQLEAAKSVSKQSKSRSLQYLAIPRLIPPSTSHTRCTCTNSQTHSGALVPQHTPAPHTPQHLLTSK